MDPAESALDPSRTRPAGGLALPFARPAPRTLDAGETFAREVEEATVRFKGGARSAERMLERSEDRRAGRHAAFEESSESEPRTRDGAEHPGEAPSTVPSPSPRAPTEPSAHAESEPPPAPPSEPKPAPAQSANEPAPAAERIVSDASGAPVGVLASTTNARPTTEAAPAAVRAVAGAGTPESLRALAPSGPARAEAPEARPAVTASPSEAALVERAEEILRQIRLHATAGVKRLTLELEPAELGRLSIQLALRAGRLAAIVRADEPQTLELLESRRAELGALLAERGVQAETLRFEARLPASRRRPAQASPALDAPRPLPPARERGREASPQLDTLA
jgi:hypothetical protein